MIAARQIAFGGGKRKPYDAEIEYLESTGTQYIDTGIIPDADTGIRICASRPVNTNDVYIAGLRNNNNQTRWCIGWSNNSKWYWGYGVSYASYVDADKVDFRLNYLNDGKIIVEDFSTTLRKLTFVPAYNIRLFGSAGVKGNYTSAQVKIYSATITQGSRIILDLIPVRVGDVGYMYDRVSGQLFGNAGTGAFVLGSDAVSVNGGGITADV